jgi:hypothetical protein
METMEIDQPEQQALMIITASRWLGVSALDIGRAVCFRGYSPASKERIGRELATALVQRGLVSVTGNNRFVACEKRP